MDQSLREKRCHVVIVQGIIHNLTVFTIFDQLGLSKRPQLVGNSGFGHTQQSGNIANAHFGVNQGANYPYPGGIAEYLEQFRQIQEGFLVRHDLSDPVDDFLMNDITVALVNINFL
jgi:hypothetical protein